MTDEQPDYMEQAVYEADEVDAFDHFLRGDSAQRAKCSLCAAEDFHPSSIKHKPGCAVGALIGTIARTLEALDTERAAHEATKAELQAARQSNDTALAIAMQAGADAERERAWNEAIEQLAMEAFDQTEHEMDNYLPAPGESSQLAMRRRFKENLRTAIRAMRKDTPQ